MIEAIIKYPFIEGAVIIALTAFSAALWSARSIDPCEGDIQERIHGQGAVISQLNGVITAGTIILGAVGAVVALHAGLADAEKYHLLWSGVFTLISISVSVWTLGMLPHRALKYNVVKVRAISIMAALSSLLFVAGCLRSMFAVWQILSK